MQSGQCSKGDDRFDPQGEGPWNYSSQTSPKQLFERRTSSRPVSAATMIDHETAVDRVHAVVRIFYTYNDRGLAKSFKGILTPCVVAKDR